MATVGRMDGAFFVSRVELLSWANSTFRLNLSKVEQCSNGAVYCQIIDACHPGSVTMKKVNWSARADHEAIPNYKILQQSLDRCGVQRHIEVDKLIRGKYQDNLEMLQWIKTYYDRTFHGGDYDPAARRFADNPPEWAPRHASGAAQQSQQSGASATREGGQPARPASGRPAATARHSTGGIGSTGGYGHSAGSAGAAAAPVAGMVPEEEHERLREEVVDLKITVDGLETERDFYFQKLRDIEILSQALEANPDPHMTVAKFVEDVQRILYARDDDDEA